ncbi:LacI family DNA-binding transcriptional regulator [Roseovarius litorisediminis]|uniref:LacI family DNA-binding transcriptional regulator n=1 Tax=Roseovarius litorisediminis TaxID=1312363 RepID=UPI000A271A29|nr:LacI family DNA-binding transcriptional regulator [Roseovarius litorisediminis]
MRQPVTIKDVAQHAGCGVASVSRVLNDSGPSSADLRQRVIAAVDDLGFEFSEVGRSLQSSTTRTIGCVVPSLANPVYADAVQGAQETFRLAGYQTLLVCTNYDPEIETQAIRTLTAKQVDGFVLTVSDALASDGLKSIQNREIPHCLLFNMAPDDEQSWSVDDRSAAMAVADAFVEKGHRHVGFLALKFKSSDRARQRYQGFAEGCSRNGLKKPALLEIDEDSQNLTDLLNVFLQENPALTGIFASNDFLALATIRSARSLGLGVPEDLSIIGFDGIEVGTMVEPSLATIVTDPKMMGSGAARTVLSVIDGTPPPALPDPELSFSFRAGGSLAPPVAERADGEKAATLSPSNNPTKKNAKIQLERSK